MRHNDHNNIEYILVRNDWLDYCVLPPSHPLDLEFEVLLDDVEVLGGRAPDEVLDSHPQVVVVSLKSC